MASEEGHDRGVPGGTDAGESGGGGPKDYTRQLGVVESLVAITQQCPSVSVRRVAEQALDTVKAGGADELRKQVYFVLTAMKGWRGERARQVHDSLSAFLEQGDRTQDSSRDPSAAE